MTAGVEGNTVAPMRQLWVALWAIFSYFFVGQGALFAQALSNRDAESDFSLRTQAVADGRIPDTDTWPRATALVPSGEQTGGVDLEVTADVAVRNSSGYWSSQPDAFQVMPNVAEFTLHTEEKGHWGIQLHSDFHSNQAGWHVSSLVLPENGDLFPLDAHFLTQGWLWYNFQPLQVQIGRDQIHWGPLDDSLLPSSRLAFFDMVHTSLEAGNWKLEWIVSTPETRTDGGNSTITTSLLMNLHRIEFRSPSWRLAASEIYLVSRDSGVLTLADMFPVIVSHQADMVPNNNCLVIDGEWVPVPGVRLMGQVGFDDIDASLFGMPDDSVPTIWAGILGGEWVGLNKDGRLTLHTELGYTHYLYGNYSDSATKAIYRLVQYARTETQPLTSPYGPGTAWITSRAEWVRQRLTVGTKLEVYSTKDGVSFDTPYVRNDALLGWGSTANVRWSWKADYRWNDVWSAFVNPSVESDPDGFGTQVRIGIRGRWSTDPGFLW